MKRDDLLIFIAGLIVVLIISILANQPGTQLHGIFQLPGDSGIHDRETDSLIFRQFAQSEPPVAVYETFTIQLVDNPFNYPRIYLPGQFDRSTTAGMIGPYLIPDGERKVGLPIFGIAPHGTAKYETDQSLEWIPIGTLEQKRGGISTIFSIPTTDAWRIRTEVTADRHPDRAIFRYALCDATTGAILDGGEITGPGGRTSIVFTTGRKMYFIINQQNVDRYRIFLDIQK